MCTGSKQEEGADRGEEGAGQRLGGHGKRGQVCSPGREGGKELERKRVHRVT